MRVVAYRHDFSISTGLLPERHRLETSRGVRQGLEALERHPWCKRQGVCVNRKCASKWLI